MIVSKWRRGFVVDDRGRTDRIAAAKDKRCIVSLDSPFDGAVDFIDHAYERVLRQCESWDVELRPGRLRADERCAGDVFRAVGLRLTERVAPDLNATLSDLRRRCPRQASRPNKVSVARG